MLRGLESLMLFSEDAAKLAKFYKDKVGLKTTGEFEMGDKGQKVYVFEFSKTSDLYIVDEPKVKGKNKTPQCPRIVDSLGRRFLFIRSHSLIFVSFVD